MSSAELTPDKNMTYGERFEAIRAAWVMDEPIDMIKALELRVALMDIYTQTNHGYDKMHRNDGGLVDAIKFLERITEPDKT